jgi:hypothetical protein
MKAVVAWVQTRQSADDSREDRAILSFTLLLAVLVAGVVISLTHAQPNPLLTSLFSTLN